MTQASQIVQLATKDCPHVEYWQAAGTLEPWATVRLGQVQRHWPVYGREFRLWLRGLYLVENDGQVPGGSAFKDAVETIAAGVLRTPVCPLFVRVAGNTYVIHIDLGDDLGRAVRVTAEGWRVAEQPAVKFRRAKAFLPLPEPELGGDIAELRKYVNVAGDDDWRLLLAWLVAALRPNGPYPVLLLRAEQGAGKSTTARILRSLIDPNEAALRTEPKEPRDLMITARNGWVIAQDNVTRLPGWFSDCLCRLATGGGFATRALYTDDEEAIFDAMRPTLLNGITEFVDRPDLLDRLVTIELPAIAEDKRRAEEELWAAFRRARGRIFGALLDVLAGSIREHAKVQLPRLPRMADFAIVGVAIERAKRWPEGSFLESYADNRLASTAMVLDDWILTGHVTELAAEGFTGTATELLRRLEALALGEHDLDHHDKMLATLRRQIEWPKRPKDLSDQLRRYAPELAKVGILVSFTRLSHGKRTRQVSLKKKVEE